MTDEPLLTVEQFHHLLQEGDRWIELAEGRLIRHQPPDDVHGNVVRNVSRALARHARQQVQLAPCFDLGLVMAKDPATIWCPAVSCFPLPAGFAEADQLITETVPQLVIEIASTNDRRKDVAKRVDRYHQWGVVAVWVFDPIAREVHAFHTGKPPRAYREHETLRDEKLLPGFEQRVADAFADPKWMSDDKGLRL